MAANTTEGKSQEWAERLQASNNRPKLTADALAANDNKQVSIDCADAEPYIPTYLAALKKPVKTVTLDGVPLRHNNTRQLNSNTFEESTTNTGNHCGVTAERSEELTNRSSCSEEDVEWADDDDAFIQQVNKCKAQRHSQDDYDHEQQPQRGGYNATGNNNNYTNTNNNNNNNTNDGGKRRSNRKPRRGWQKVDETSSKANQSNEGGRFAKRSTNNANNNNKGKEGNAAPSAGRFDSLSRANWGQK